MYANRCHLSQLYFVRVCNFVEGRLRHTKTCHFRFSLIKQRMKHSSLCNLTLLKGSVLNSAFCTRFPTQGIVQHVNRDRVRIAIRQPPTSQHHTSGLSVYCIASSPSPILFRNAAVKKKNARQLTSWKCLTDSRRAEIHSPRTRDTD